VITATVAHVARRDLFKRSVHLERTAVCAVALARALHDVGAKEIIMNNIDVDSHELAAVEGGFYWPGPGCNPQPWPCPWPNPWPGPIYDLSMICWPIDPVI
jgi:hypothetical protein